MQKRVDRPSFILLSSSYIGLSVKIDHQILLSFV
jgi:hypothetical protein